jgi:hypothetical protein
LGKKTTFRSPYTYSNAPDELYPKSGDYACIKVKRSSHIVLENFRAIDCWPTFVYTTHSSYISLRGSRIKGSQHVFYARGDSSGHHYLLEGNHWTQDTSGRMWSQIDWDDSHDGPYNGGLFGSEDLKGNVLVRDNLVENAFNGVRMKAVEAPFSENPKDPRDTNRNVEIYDNAFYNTRDNCFEPETDAYNWWVHHNFIKNAHKPWSLSKVDSGYWYFFANTGYFDDRPGVGNNGGGLLKVSHDSPHTEFPTYFFNNSFYLRSPVAKSGKLRHFSHWNNAYEFCSPQDHSGDICSSRPPMLEDYDLSSSQAFDHDAINLTRFPEILTNNGEEAHGLSALPAIFNDAIGGDLALPAGSPLVDAGKVLSIPSANWRSDFDGAAPDIGAYENGKLIDGPSYRNRGRERPRIVRITWPAGSRKIKFRFSVPVETALSSLEMIARYGTTEVVSKCTLRGYLLRCRLTPRSGTACYLPDEIILPDGITNDHGDPATLWGAVISVG